MADPKIINIPKGYPHRGRRGEVLSESEHHYVVYVRPRRGVVGYVHSGKTMAVRKQDVVDDLARRAAVTKRDGKPAK